MLENIDDRSRLEPPDYEANIVLRCSYCDGGIYDGEEYYNIEGINYCKNCLEDEFMRYAEIQEFWEE